jgi:hypothetical protein
MHIEAVLPSRGLLYAQTVVGLLANISPDNLTITIGEPMPKCFNDGVLQALEKGADYIWMVEEDNEFPEGILERMVELAQEGHKIITADYTIGGGQSHIYKDKSDDILWCGVGCTLIAREVFERIPAPWFEVDRHLNYDGDHFRINPIPKETVGNKYGGHDALFFYTKAKPLGYKITVLPGHYQHFRCKEVPKRELNNGQYTIYSL